MATKKAAWTVMVYLAGDNNLTTECMFALTEMKKASLKDLNVIAQFDPNDPYLPTHRYEINKSNKSEALCYDLIDRAVFDNVNKEVHFNDESLAANDLAALRKLGAGFHIADLDDAKLIDSEKSDDVITDDTDTGSPITLYNFISFCLEKYPADHYMVVLSGHAGGTERDYLLRDESSAGSLTFNELKQVFRRVIKDLKGQLIDIVGMDNCLMSMAEICYELRGLAEIVVGCESFSPASGWPYCQILERLQEDCTRPKLPKGESVAEAAAKAIVEEYVNYYSDYWIAGLSVTQSALNVSEVENLQRHVDKLARAMEKKLVAEHKRSQAHRSKKDLFRDALLLAHWEAQSYNGEQFVDLYDFCDCLENRVGEDLIAEHCRNVKEFLKSEFVLKSCFCGADYQYSYGVSMYFPWSQVAPAYWNLDFVSDTYCGWGNFLKTYTLLTRREPRGWEGRTKLGVAFGSSIDATLSAVRMTGERMTSERMTGERMTSERMTGERMTGERMTGERMTGERVSKNRIHSMRNPPNIFFPDDCVRDKHNCMTAQEILRFGQFAE